MCVGPMKPKAAPSGISAEERAEQEQARKEEKQQREEELARQQAERKEAREEALERKQQQTRGGTGARSLLTGSRGGAGFLSRGQRMGYFDGTL